MKENSPKGEALLAQALKELSKKMGEKFYGEISIHFKLQDGNIEQIEIVEKKRLK